MNFFTSTVRPRRFSKDRCSSLAGGWLAQRITPDRLYDSWSGFGSPMRLMRLVRHHQQDHAAFPAWTNRKDKRAPSPTFAGKLPIMDLEKTTIFECTTRCPTNRVDLAPCILPSQLLRMFFIITKIFGWSTFRNSHSRSHGSTVLVDWLTFALNEDMDSIASRKWCSITILNFKSWLTFNANE